MYHFLHESWPRLEGVVSLFCSGGASGKETPELVLVLAFHLLLSRTGTGDFFCFFLRHEASGFKAFFKQKMNKITKLTMDKRRFLIQSRVGQKDGVRNPKL